MSNVHSDKNIMLTGNCGSYLTQSFECTINKCALQKLIHRNKIDNDSH